MMHNECLIVVAIINGLDCLKVVHGFNNCWQYFLLPLSIITFFFFKFGFFLEYLCVVFLCFSWLREIDRELLSFQNNLNGIDFL